MIDIEENILERKVLFEKNNFFWAYFIKSELIVLLKKFKKNDYLRDFYHLSDVDYIREQYFLCIYISENDYISRFLTTKEEVVLLNKNSEISKHLDQWHDVLYSVDGRTPFLKQIINRIKSINGGC